MQALTPNFVINSQEQYVQLNSREIGLSPSNKTRNLDDNTVWYKFDVDILKLTIDPSGFNEDKNIKFNWNMTTFQEDYIEIQLDFEEPNNFTTTSEDDYLNIEILDEKFFSDL